MKPFIKGKLPIVLAAAAALCVAAVLLLIIFSKPPHADDETSAPTETTIAPTEPAPEVRLYQCDPALAEKWQALAQRYTSETGIRVTVTTPENGDCATALPQQLQSGSAPSIFCLHHSHELDLWKSYCLDISDSVIANALQQDIFALRSNGAVYGVAANVESYGIIYNSQLLARAGYTASDITDFQSLINIIENITANKKSLGFSAFASPDLQDTAHGSLLCLLAGLSDNADVLRSFWDLYRANCVRSGASLTQSTSSDGLNDFLQEKAVFYLGGTWNYSDLSGIEDYFLTMLPVYTSENGNNPGLHHACTSYWCVNAQASAQDQAAALDFLGWLVTATEEAAAPADSLGLLTPYKDTKSAGNPLEKLVLDSLSGENHVQWNSCDELTPELLAQLGQLLAVYTKDPSDENWNAIATLKRE